MQFIQPNLAIIVSKFEQLKDNDKPLWGSMSAQRMIEHLTDTLVLCRGNHSISLKIPEENVPRAMRFLQSEHPMPKNFNVTFATPEMSIRNKSIQEAITEFKNEWNAFENHFKTNPGLKTLHPYFGELDIELWLMLHSKHISHHLEQFGVEV